MLVPIVSIKSEKGCRIDFYSTRNCLRRRLTVQGNDCEDKTIVGRASKTDGIFDV